MDTARSENKGFALPPARELLRSSGDDQDMMVLDEPEQQQGHQDLPSIQTNDDFIRHRLSDMSVSHNRILSPLEPHYKTYSRKSSITDPAAFRRPSVSDANNLPLPNSTCVSRRGSIATDYDYPSRSPSPSPYTFPPKRMYEDHSYARRDSLPMNTLPSIPPASSVYDSFQRRHSIATPAPENPSNNRFTNKHNNISNKHRAFQFPATIQESPNHGTFSAPPSPPRSALNNVGQDPMHESRFRSNMGGSINQNTAHTTHEHNIPSMEHLMNRRASMPAVHNLISSRRGSLASELDDDRRKDSPYSRSPELRVSHKLAERKRRKEMKELFDELRDSLPVEKNMKTSKWEILSKAVEYISILKRRDYDLENEVMGLRREVDMLKRMPRN